MVLIAIVAMPVTKPFRNYAREHVPEMIFAAPYLLSLYCYNYPYWARGSFPRFAIPIIPFVFLALEPWLPKDRRLLWVLTPITAVHGKLRAGHSECPWSHTAGIGVKFAVA